MKKKEIAIAAFLIAIGCTQMIGDVINVPLIKALGAATGASPAPKVFTAQNGFETYANKFFLEWQDGSENKKSLELTPEVYSSIEGPYNRRNAYGAVFSYGPVLDANPLTRPMFRTVLYRSICSTRPVIAEIGVPSDAPLHGPVRVRLEPRRPDYLQHFNLTHEVRCHG